MERESRRGGEGVVGRFCWPFVFIWSGGAFPPLLSSLHHRSISPYELCWCCFIVFQMPFFWDVHTFFKYLTKKEHPNADSQLDVDVNFVFTRKFSLASSTSFGAAFRSRSLRCCALSQHSIEFDVVCYRISFSAL